jgi:hypothetical protein
MNSVRKLSSKNELHRIYLSITDSEYYDECEGDVVNHKPDVLNLIMNAQKPGN